MNKEEIEYIKSCASIIQQSSDHNHIIEILERLQAVEMDIETLKATRIGAIVNKLTKRKELNATLKSVAWELVNDWKEIANAAVQQQNIQQTQYERYQREPSPPRYDEQPRGHRKRTISSMMGTESRSNSTNTNTNNDNDTTNSSHNHKRQRLGPQGRVDMVGPKRYSLHYNFQNTSICI